MRTGAPIHKCSNETGLEEDSESGGDESNFEAADVIESENENKVSINADYRCKVDGCLLQGQGEDTSAEGSAREHNCHKCKASVHLYCCEKILGLVCNDSDDPLFCSMCIVDEIQQDGPNRNKRNIASQGEGTGNSNNPKSGNVPQTLSCARSGYVCRTFSRARKDWSILLCNGQIPQSVRTTKRVKDGTVRTVLRFIFSLANIPLLLWSTKRMKVDGKFVDFPSVLRLKTAAKMYRDYKKMFQATPSAIEDNNSSTEICISRTTFFDIVMEVTNGQQKRKSAVDYVLGALVYDNINVARDIVAKEVQTTERADVLTKQIDATEQFLKFVYLEHIASDNDIFHNPNLALAEQVASNSRVLVPRESHCSTYLTPFQVIKEIKDEADAERADISEALEEIKNKVVLFMGHQQRCHNQERRITELFEELKADSTGSNSTILIDYKMKFEAIRFREKTTEFFGKRAFLGMALLCFILSSPHFLKTIWTPT